MAQVINHIGRLLQDKNVLGIAHFIVECITPQDMFEVATKLNIGELCLKANVGVAFFVLFDGEYIVDCYIWILEPESSIVLSMRHSDVLIHFVNAHRRHFVDDANRHWFSVHNIGGVHRHSRLIDAIVGDAGLTSVKCAVHGEQVNVDIRQHDIDEPKGECIVTIGRHQTYYHVQNLTSTIFSIIKTVIIITQQNIYAPGYLCKDDSVTYSDLCFLVPQWLTTNKKDDLYA